MARAKTHAEAAPVAADLDAIADEPRRKGSVLKFLGALACVAIAGCAVAPPAPAPDNIVSAAFKRPQPPAVILLVQEPAADPVLRRGDAQAARETTKQLTSAGFQVIPVPLEDFRRLILLELPPGRKGPVPLADYEAASVLAMQHLARIGTAQARAALVLRIRLLVRLTSIAASTASWDGQRRPIVFTGPSDLPARSQGRGPGLSLEAWGVQTDGSVAFRVFGGAALPYRIDRVTGQASDRPNLFDDPTELAQGAAIALAPLIATPP